MATDYGQQVFDEEELDWDEYDHQKSMKREIEDHGQEKIALLRNEIQVYRIQFLSRSRGDFSIPLNAFFEFSDVPRQCIFWLKGSVQPQILLSEKIVDFGQCTAYHAQVSSLYTEKICENY